jgi:hypothetical protein
MNILAHACLIATPSSLYSNVLGVTLAVKNLPSPLYIYNTISLLIRFLSRIIFCYRFVFVKITTFIAASQPFFAVCNKVEVSL